MTRRESESKGGSQDPEKGHLFFGRLQSKKAWQAGRWRFASASAVEGKSRTIKMAREGISVEVVS